MAGASRNVQGSDEGWGAFIAPTDRDIHGLRRDRCGVINAMVASFMLECYVSKTAKAGVTARKTGIAVSVALS